MKKITPISSWQNGQEIKGTLFDLKSIYDNLLDTATFLYTISSEQTSHLEGETEVIDSYAKVLVEANLFMNGQDYQDWGTQSDVNEWAYQWAALKLNLTFVPDNIPV